MKSPEESARQFEMNLEIDAPRDAVWQALSTDRELRRWFPIEARITARVGGEVLWRWKDAHSWPQRIEICEPGRRLKTRYESTVDDGAGGKRPLFVDFILEGEGGNTTLRLIHSGFGPEADFDGEYDGISGGWPHELRCLRLYLEKHHGRDRVVVWTQREILAEPDVMWRRLTGDGGLACGHEIDRMREGDAFRFETPMGDVFEGEVLGCHPRNFCGVDRVHGDAFLRFAVEPACGLWLWLGTWGRPADEIRALQARWDTLAEKLLGADRQPAAAPSTKST